MTEKKEIKVEIGSHNSVIIDKLFGPTIFADLRITPDCERGWVIERKWIKTGMFIEWCVIPAQIDREFTDMDEYEDKGDE